MGGGCKVVIGGSGEGNTEVLQTETPLSNFCVAAQTGMSDDIDWAVGFVGPTPNPVNVFMGFEFGLSNL